MTARYRRAVPGQLHLVEAILASVNALTLAPQLGHVAPPSTRRRSIDRIIERKDQDMIPAARSSTLCLVNLCTGEWCSPHSSHSSPGRVKNTFDTSSCNYLGSLGPACRRKFLHGSTHFQIFCRSCQSTLAFRLWYEARLLATCPPSSQGCQASVRASVPAAGHGLHFKTMIPRGNIRVRF